jgi:hypothetical protein
VHEPRAEEARHDDVAEHCVDGAAGHHYQRGIAIALDEGGVVAHPQAGCKAFREAHVVRMIGDV